MTKLEERSDEELMEGIRGGEQECMDVLIERYKGQVRKEARTLYLIGGDSDDLIQEGMLGLFKAIRDYRPEKEEAGILRHSFLQSYCDILFPLYFLSPFSPLPTPLPINLRFHFISGISIAERIIPAPANMRNVICSFKSNTENRQPNTASRDSMTAAFVSSTYLWERVCSR